VNLNINFSVFNSYFQVQIDTNGYQVCIHQEDTDKSYDVWLDALTLPGAIFKGWRYGRMYAKLFSESQVVLIYREYVDTEGDNRPVWWGVIPVGKVVGLWFKK
jgi:hypothetical protein